VSDDNHKGTVDHALDVFVYAPLGLALLARDSMPGMLQAFAARGRAEIETRKQAAESKVEQARAVGQFALDYGAPVVRRRVEERLNEARGRAEQSFSGLVVGRDDRAPSGTQPEPVAPPRPSDTYERGSTSTPATAPVAPRPTNGAGPVVTTVPDARMDDTTTATLSIPDYDELSASQVVQRLPGLSHDELEAIRAYETHGRGRRTILGKIDQLAR